MPDHATIARFRQRHEMALAGLFAQVLELCARAGLVHLDLVAVDRTKIAANASRFANRTYEQLAREIIGEAVDVDAAENAKHGTARGHELPAEFANQQGRRGWIRDARKQLERRRDEEPVPVPGPRPARLTQAHHRLLEDHQTEVDANTAYARSRAGGKDKTGRGFGRPPDPVSLPELPAGTVNTSDPDSHKMRSAHGPAQAYNAQAVCTREQIIIAAEITTAGPDFGQLRPMIQTARRELEQAGVDSDPATVLADSGYWNQDAMDHLAADGITVLIPPDAKTRSGTRPGWDGGRYAFMRAVLKEPEGRWRYARRQGDRARLRRLEVQPPHRPLPQTRPRSLQQRMETRCRHPQPPQALPRHPTSARLKEPAGRPRASTGRRHPPHTAGPHPSPLIHRCGRSVLSGRRTRMKNEE